MLTQKPTNAAFQLYSTCIEHMVSVIPDALPLSQAVVLPTSVDTAAVALYGHLKLPLPTLDPSPMGKKILIWGGSSSVGCSAIQLAIASGLEVVTTASRANHDFVKSLGATDVFDYNEPGVVDQLVDFFEPGDFIVDCISTKETESTCAEILGRIGGGKLPVVNIPQGTYPANVQPSFGELLLSLVQNQISDMFEVICVDSGHASPHIGDTIWHKFMPEALASRKFQAKPDPQIIQGGLEKVKQGIDLLREGVSAKKIVIEISSE